MLSLSLLLSVGDGVVGRLQEGGRLSFHVSRDSRKLCALASVTVGGWGFRIALMVLNHARQETFEKNPKYVKENLLERLVDLIDDRRQSAHEY